MLDTTIEEVEIPVVEQLPIDTIIEPMQPPRTYLLMFDRSVPQDELFQDAISLMEMLNIQPSDLSSMPDNIKRHFVELSLSPNEQQRDEAEKEMPAQSNLEDDKDTQS